MTPSDSIDKTRACVAALETLRDELVKLCIHSEPCKENSDHPWCDNCVVAYHIDSALVDLADAMAFAVLAD